MIILYFQTLFVSTRKTVKKWLENVHFSPRHLEGFIICQLRHEPSAQSSLNFIRLLRVVVTRCWEEKTTRKNQNKPKFTKHNEVIAFAPFSKATFQYGFLYFFFFTLAQLKKLKRFYVPGSSMPARSLTTAPHPALPPKPGCKRPCSQARILKFSMFQLSRANGRNVWPWGWQMTGSGSQKLFLRDSPGTERARKGMGATM